MDELSRPAQIRTELLAGLTVSLALVPEAVAAWMGPAGVSARVEGLEPGVGGHYRFVLAEDDSTITVNAHTLNDGEEAIVAEHLRSALLG